MKPGTEAPSEVLDASAVLAYLQGEPGASRARSALHARAVISTVNLAEVLGRVAAAGRSVAGTEARLGAIGLQIEPFSEADAAVTGALLPSTRELGLSLADRACLALAMRLERPVLTTDRDLAKAEVGVKVQPIR